MKTFVILFVIFIAGHDLYYWLIDVDLGITLMAITSTIALYYYGYKAVEKFYKPKINIEEWI